ALSGNQGLVLSNAALGRLNVANMSLISASSIDLHGATTVNANNLTLKARSLDGYANDGQSATLQADTLTLVGGDQAAPAAGTGTGTLTLKARQLTLGTADPQAAGSSQAMAIGGFNQLNVTAGELTTQGKGRLQVAGAVNMNAGLVSGGAASDWQLVTPDVFTVTGNAQGPTPPASPALGALLSLQGSRVVFDTAVLMPSGRLTLAATGTDSGDSVSLGPHAALELSGRVMDFSGKTVGSPGGAVTLTSAAGDVNIQPGAMLNVAGGNDSAAGGDITIRASQGQATIGGDLVANQSPGGDGRGGFSLDAGSIGNFSGLTATLAQGGFTGTVSIRAHTGDLSVASGDTVRAHRLSITADSGNVDIYGAIDASGSQAGRVSINAGGDLNVHGAASIDAHATGADTKGGYVFLGTTRGNLTFAQGAKIDVTGTQRSDVKIHQGTRTVTRTDTGQVRFRLPRASVGGSDLSGAASGINGSGSTVVEAYQVYDLTGGTLGGAAVTASAGNPYYQDAADFMHNAQSVMAGLGLANAANVQLRPGVEIQAQGSLTLSAAMDLSQWRFGPQDTVPGMLTLRAGGNLNIADNLSAGFTFGPNAAGVPMDLLRKDDSWSLRLVGGADLTSADPRAVIPGTGNVTTGGGVTVRTGTGNIDLAAGGNLILDDSQSVIYTAGVDGGPGTYYPVLADYLLNAQYPVGGGNVRVAVGGDIVAHASPHFINYWLPRVGGAGKGDYGDLPTTWAVNFANFDQGVGALGGGDVSVSAGGDITDLSVVMPTIGTQVGQAQYDSTGHARVITNQVVVSGGTELSINAGGSIHGGVFYAGKGQGQLLAGGLIGASAQTSLDPILAVDSGQFNVRAGGNIGLETVVDPTMLPQNINQGLPGSKIQPSYFFTYGSDSAVHLTSLAGDILLDNNTNTLTHTFSNSTMWAVYPGTFSADALQGNINLTSDGFTLFPSVHGQLQMLAGGSVLVLNNGTPKINVS
ncbi:MAG TPA: hypothetical protein VKA13_02665, partial [Gammaproteobacteria bacterium]|nr:hypothetical protein [Gammaproteobacteria bacterium]